MRKPPDPLGRFYTDPLIGQAFASMLDSEDPASVIDLGAGGGSLSAAVSGRWREAAIQTVDLDPAAGKASNSRLAASGCRKHRHLTADILDERLPDALEGGLFDLCVSNPPYTALAWRKGFSRILDEAGFGRITEPGRPVPAEALFLAQLLRLSRPGAEIGLILWPFGLKRGITPNPGSSGWPPKRPVPARFRDDARPDGPR